MASSGDDPKPDPKQQHDAEQRQAAMREMSGWIATIYRNLVDEKLPPTKTRDSGEVALYLTGQYIRAFWSRPASTDE